MIRTLAEADRCLSAYGHFHDWVIRAIKLRTDDEIDRTPAGEPLHYCTQTATVSLYLLPPAVPQSSSAHLRGVLLECRSARRVSLDMASSPETPCPWVVHQIDIDGQAAASPEDGLVRLRLSVDSDVLTADGGWMVASCCSFDFVEGRLRELRS